MLILIMGIGVFVIMFSFVCCHAKEVRSSFNLILVLELECEEKIVLYAGHEKKRGIAGRDFKTKYDRSQLYLASDSKDPACVYIFLYLDLSFLGHIPVGNSLSTLTESH